MKKYLFILACACIAFAACDPEQKPGDDNSVPGLDELPDIGGGGDKTPTQELTPGEQQAKLQSVGEKLLAEFPAEEFENLAKIAEAFDKKFGNNEDYDLSALEKWAEDSFEMAFSDNYREEENGNGYHSISSTNLLLLLSNHTGLFTFGANKVTVAPYKGTKAVFTVEGKTYEAELTSSETVTTAYFKYEYHSEESSDYSEYKYDGVSEITVNVPETINVSITENGTPLATVTAKFATNFTQGGLKLNTDALSMEVTATINGYELKVSKTGYDGTAAKVQTMTTLSKDGKTLLTLVASADLLLKQETVIYENTDGSYHYKYTATQVIADKAQNLKVAMDILGEIQVVGTCSDANKLYEELDAMWAAIYSNEEGADVAKANVHLGKINNLLDLGVYYDNGSNKQADIELELLHKVFEDGDWTWEDYDLIPVLVFTNGSRNKIEDFFTEEAFSSLIESVERLGDSYATVLGYFLEKEEAVMPDYEY